MYLVRYLLHIALYLVRYPLHIALYLVRYPLPIAVAWSVTHVLSSEPARAQTTNDPFPSPIEATDGVVRVDYREFAIIPDINGAAARMMVLVDEPGSQRLFVNDMRGPLYSISYDGRTVVQYIDINDAQWGVRVQSSGRERGFQSFAFHPEFARAGARGYGKFYTWTDVADTTHAADFTPGGGGHTHETVLLEWTARAASAERYDGDAPRELMRIQQPFANHNAGLIAFNPLARDGTADYGMLYIGCADGGSGGDPLNLAQNRSSVFGKILRIDPLGRNSENGKYGIPADNPFVGGETSPVRGASGAVGGRTSVAVGETSSVRGASGAVGGRTSAPVGETSSVRGEIFALGVRNPQRFGWDASTRAMYVADIGQGIVEELSPVTRGANLGWNVWEGSFRFAGRGSVDLANPRSDSTMTYPIAEYDHRDPILQNRAAATGVVVYRSDAIPQLRGRILFGDIPSGEVFHVSADDPPRGGHAAIRRVLLNDAGEAKTLLQLVQQKNAAQGRQPAARADLRLGTGRNGEVFLLNKADGVVRLLVRPER